jgi:hypothetical protein
LREKIERKGVFMAKRTRTQTESIIAKAKAAQSASRTQTESIIAKAKAAQSASRAETKRVYEPISRRRKALDRSYELDKLRAARPGTLSKSQSQGLFARPASGPQVPKRKPKPKPTPASQLKTVAKATHTVGKKIATGIKHSVGRLTQPGRKRSRP